MRKAQTSVDLLIIIAVMLIIFAILFNFIVKDLFIERVDKEIHLNAKSNIENVGMAINEVYLLGDGSNRTIYLPDRLVHLNEYNITVYNTGSLLLETYNKRISFPLLTRDIETGALNKGKVVIKNVDGVVIFE